MKTAFALLAAALLTGLPIHAQQAPQAATATRTIRATGVGEAMTRPDEAHLEFGVETVAPTAQAASTANAQRMERVIAALIAAGIPRSEIQTRGFAVFPDYEHNPQTPEPRIRGYRVTNTVAARTEAIPQIGRLIDVALAAGANRVHGVRFGVRNMDTPRAEALRRATARARAQAETIAGALGVRLGPVIDASTADQPPRYVAPLEMAAMRQAADALSTPIEPGEQTVVATVSLVFAIEGSR